MKDLFLSAERRKMHEVGGRYSLDRIAGSTPGSQSTNNHKCAKSLLPEQKRHTGACFFAWSSTVQVDVFVAGKLFCFFRQIVRLKSNGASNAVGTRIVVTVAANIDKQNFFCILSLQLRGQFGYLYPWNNAVRPVPPVKRETINAKCNRCDDYHNLYYVSCRLKSAHDERQEIAEDKTNTAVANRIGQSPEEVQPHKLNERHFHAPRQRRSHRINSGNELGDQQRGPAALVERLCGA